MITSDQAKTGAIILGVAVVGYFVFTAYDKMQKTGNAIADLKKAMAEAATGAGQTISSGVKTVRNTIADSTGLISRDNSSDTNQDYVAPDYVTEVPFSKWPQSVKDNINMLNQTRGITRVWKYEGDFVGWKYYSNGTLISPDGYYASDNAVNTANEYDSGVMVIPDSFSGLTFDATKYQWQ